MIDLSHLFLATLPADGAPVVQSIWDPKLWAAVPFGFWSVVFFVFGTIVGSFLNVCIHRMPLGESIISPPSHCPHCRYSIPWYLNIPIVTWLWLRGKCRNCGAPISPRYFLVELLTGLLFLGAWLAHGHHSAWIAIVDSAVLAGLVVATFIDFEHFIIPDEITLGGIVAGILISFALPVLHGESSPWHGGLQGLIGAAAGAGIVYLIVRAGKLMFGRQRVELGGEAHVVFGESSLHLPDREVPYEDLFYRRSDAIVLQARRLELPDRCYCDVPVRLTRDELKVGEDRFQPDQVAQLEAWTPEIVLPREAMGLGDVKFMAAIGAFLGWPAVLFSLTVSSLLGSAVGLLLILAGRREWSSRMPYGPYIAAAAALWIFRGPALVRIVFPF
ncbi:MAG: prepilin peptidase [Verrucomicrobiota bacterium]